jgi:hypothetical protein
MLVVDRARVGRVFLVGDAAHLNPPWGGHGFNTGVGDAVDVGWKLAAVLDGWGGPGLLDAYERERRGVQEEVVRVATENMDSSPADLAALLPSTDEADEAGDAEDAEGAEDPYAETARRIHEAKKLEFHSLGLVLGYRYDASPIVVDEGGDPPPSHPIEYIPTTYPGARLPHVWLDEPDGTSIFDVLGPEFSLLRLDPGVDVGPFEAAADALGVPLSTVDVDVSIEPSPYDRPLLLVRPDQHVAWRGASVPDQPHAVLERVCGY